MTRQECIDKIERNIAVIQEAVKADRIETFSPQRQFLSIRASMFQVMMSNPEHALNLLVDYLWYEYIKHGGMNYLEIIDIPTKPVETEDNLAKQLVNINN